MMLEEYSITIYRELSSGGSLIISVDGVASGVLIVDMR